MKHVTEVISKIEEWAGKDIKIEELTEGLTNKNYKITVENKSYVIRIPGEGSDLFIDREVELHNTLSASSVGVGAKVFKYFKDDYIIVTEFINGQVMSIPLFKDKNRIIKAVNAIKKIHENASFISNFIMFEKFNEYLEIVRKNLIKVPDGFDEAIKVVEKVKKIFLKNMPKLVPCHNDLLAENFIEEGERMRILDWELSGNNDPFFELGDFSVEQGFGEEEDILILDTYFGKSDEKKFARMNIYKYMADILWTLWAVIQHKLSKLPFDYWNYGINRFNRAMEAFNSKIFWDWLKAA